MGVRQINMIVNSIVGQALGKTTLVGTDTSFVSLGSEVFSSDANTDAVYKVLIERIGRTVNSVRAYRGDSGNLRRNSFEWGVVLQKLSMPLSNAVKNPSWLDINDNSDGDVLKPANTIKPTQKLFNKVSTWEHDATIFNRQLRFAFLSPESMGAFIDMIFTAVYNSQEVAFENLDNLCRANLAGNLVGTSRAINLLNMYNTETNKTLTVNSCLHDSDFLSYASMIISLYTKRMRKMSRTFNDGTMDRHTPRDLQNLAVLADFSERFNFVSRSQAYHDNIIVLPNYVEVPYWQGSGTTWAFEDVSAIKVMVGDDASKEVNQTGIIAVLSDIDTMGTTVQNMSTSTMYNPRRKFTNYFMQADLGYYNDTSENALVFYVAEA